jgi:hypothetical protein
MKITKERAEYLSNKANDKISSIFKELSSLENILESDEYQALIESKDQELIDVVELGCLPTNFFEFLEQLPEQF